jgi:hypothetical protein
MKPLTRRFSESIKEDLDSGPEFRRAFLTEAINSMVEGDVETGKSVLREYINGTVGFVALGQALGKSPKSLMRMLSRQGNPHIRNLFEILAQLQKLEGTSLRLQPVTEDATKAPSHFMPQISIIIPALNEAESIGHVVSQMPWPLIAECIVCDNGSTDRTAAIAAAAGARIVHSPRGYGAACLAGSQAALPASDILVYMDGDGSDIIADLERLTAPIASGEADFVLGSRIRGTREPGSMLPSQVFAAHLVSTLLRLLQGVRYTDMGPFRAIRRSSLEQLGMSELTYGWNLEMQIKAAQYRLRICEITVDYRRRIGGTSKVSGDWKASIKAATRILEVLFRVGLRRRD